MFEFHACQFAPLFCRLSFFPTQRVSPNWFVDMVVFYWGARFRKNKFRGLSSAAPESGLKCQFSACRHSLLPSCSDVGFGFYCQFSGWLHLKCCLECLTSQDTGGFWCNFGQRYSSLRKKAGCPLWTNISVIFLVPCEMSLHFNVEKSCYHWCLQKCLFSSSFS